MSDGGTAVIIFAHGSRVREANETIARLAREVSQTSGLAASAAFLDVAQPDLSAAVADAVRAGARKVLIVPCFLVFGMHVREDLPRLVSLLEADHPGLEIVVCQPLEGHPGLAEILVNRVHQALEGEKIGSPGLREG